MIHLKERFFELFAEISSIPHGSYHIEEISQYLYQKGQILGNESYRDEYGNVIIIKYATVGREEEPALIIQAHMDMVAVKTPDCTKDLQKEGLELAVEGDDLYACGTSLGADNGLAVAYCLALLEDRELSHPRLEMVFTVNEEVGMEGAEQIDLSGLKGKRMLNLDSEEEGIFQTGCAGGVCAHIELPVTGMVSGQGIGENFDNGGYYEIIISGLKGGHSGTEINQERANAILLMGRLLALLDERTLKDDSDGIGIAAFCGGEKDNAIPTECRCTVFIRKSIRLSEEKDAFLSMLRKEFEGVESQIEITVKPVKPCGQLLDTESKNRLLSFLLLVHNGVYSNSTNVSNLVEASQNLGIVQYQDSCISAEILVRSMSEIRKKLLVQKNERLVKCLGGTMQLSGDYPGWEYRVESPLRDHCIAVYESMYGKKPEVTVVHAGLECGILSAKIEQLDCISLGPNIYDIHTTRERLSIVSAKRVWGFLQNLIQTKA